ncbi:MAG: hypothetical protein DRI71_02485 [Bacteroidetes bacterium]|nr:MAG: hypothetical protein DRI71_02485 [Bacteroidota bacterium]
MRLAKNILLIIILIQSGLVYSQEASKVKKLFRSDDILELKISMNVDEVISDIDVRDEHEATLTYKQENGEDKVLDLKVMVRGKTRANVKVCRFPPLKLNFKKNQVKKTLFAKQNKLKLVTHCNTKAINEEYILREYYVYKLHQLVTPFSFNVRLCKITYEDTSGDFEPIPHYGILIEDIDDLAERNGMTEFEGAIPNQEVCERTELDRLMFFQYLVGNLDWSVPKRHNFKLVADSLKPLPVAIPYDFDYTGLVNTSYAQVPPDIDAANVKVRVFRGLCRMEGGYDDALNHFQSIRSEIYALYSDSEYLSEKSKTTSIKYIDGFYKVLDNPKSFNQKIFKACRANHKHLFNY